MPDHPPRKPLAFAPISGVTFRVYRSDRQLDVEAFLKRWKPSGGSESANFHSFANDLTDLLGVPRPDPATGDLKRDSYRFEHPVTLDRKSVV